MINKSLSSSKIGLKPYQSEKKMPVIKTGFHSLERNRDNSSSSKLLNLMRNNNSLIVGELSSIIIHSRNQSQSEQK